MPGVAESTFANALPLILFDGTFFLNAYNQTILLAIGRDGNNESYLIAWAIVESENKNSWIWFIDNVVAGCPALNEPCRIAQKQYKTTVMSDRDKGLLSAEQVALPGAWYSYCAWHLAENIKKKFGQKVRYAFWKLVYVQTLGQWTYALEKFEEAGGKVR
jgi:hypothetical protein